MISGRVTTIDNRGNLIARSNKAPREGDRVLDRRRKQIGKVISVIGPVDTPYMVIKPWIKGDEDPMSLINQEVFIDSKKR